MGIASLDDLLKQGSGISGKRVLVRCDFNVPLKDNEILDTSRIQAALPTLKKLSEARAKVILASHLGRPNGKAAETLSLRPIAKTLSQLMGMAVKFSDNIIGQVTENLCSNLKDREILLLENLRFHPGEERNDPGFAKDLAQLAQVYVNDAFGCAHRAHASTVGVARYFKQRAAGDLLLKELEQLESIKSPKRPLLCLLGGAKVSDKLPVLKTLAPHADVLAIGGAMAYTFMAARGQTVGDSLIERDQFAEANKILDAAKGAGRKFLLPTDHIIADNISASAKTRIVDEIPHGGIAVDIGPKTSSTYALEAERASTIFWNGPMGIFEISRFAGGTKKLAKAVADSTGQSVVGGGDSLAAVNAAGVASRINHLSTGGGASLEYVQGLPLPGVEALE